MEETVYRLNVLLDRLYDILGDPSLTKKEKNEVLDEIESVEAEINSIMGCWDESESLYFND